MAKFAREVIRVWTSFCLFYQFGLSLLDLYVTGPIIPFYTHNSIEKVQLPDMGSYQCAVLSESHQTMSEEGSIQLEGEFIFSSLMYANSYKSSAVLFRFLKRVETLNFGHSFSGLPHFSVEPQHMSIVANISLSLSCVAHGPPEPVRVIWLQDGAQLNSLKDPVALSPSTLNLTGIIFHSLLAQQSRPHMYTA